MKSGEKKILKRIFAAVGALFCIASVISGILLNFNFGFLMQFVIGVILILWFNVPQTRIVKIIKSVIIAGFGLIFAVIGIIIVKANTSAAKFDEDAVIVLGCAVRGTAPTEMLCSRLDKCIEYIQKNENAVIVVSGGQGEQEDISEAQAMADYLIERGIPAGSIIKEDKSTSTEENFEFSKKLLDDYFAGDYSICYITNDFHSYRAGIFAENAGFKNPKCFNTPTNILSIVPSYLRETAAVVHYWIFGN